MNIFCKNCGSQNHASDDCSKPYNGWRDREPKVEVRQNPVPKPIRDHEDEGEKTGSATSAKMKRKDFPFLRETTRRSIDERIARMTARKPETQEAKDREQPPRPEIVLPIAAKKKKAIINTKQESLF